MSVHEWLLIDLHMHGKASRPYDGKRVNPNQNASDMVKVLKGAGIDFFSVTDHCVFDAVFYDELEKAANAEGLSLLYGAELTVYVDPPHSNHFHMGVYLKPGVDKTAFSNALRNLYKPGPDGTNTSKPTFGAIIEELFGLQNEFIIIPEADKSAGLNNTWKYLQEHGLLERCENNLKHGISHFYNGYDSKESFDKNGANQWAKSFFEETTQFDKETEGMSPSEIDLMMQHISDDFKKKPVLLTPKETRLAKIIKEYGSSFCYFSFSDWHNAEPYNPRIDNYIFGSKSNPFESVWAATEDPLSRLRKQKHGENKPGIPDEYIKNVSFSTNGKIVSIDFQPELNAVIGKRASGKSLLLNVLAYLSSSGNPNSKLGEYSSSGLIDTNSIRCTTFGGVAIKPGTLGSVALIQQNQIEQIYRDTNTAEESFAKFFPELNAIPRGGFDSLLEMIRSLKPYPNAFSSVNVYLSAEGFFKGLSFEALPLPNFSKVESKEDALIIAFDELIVTLRQHNLSSERFEEQKRNLLELILHSKKKINLYKSFAERVNSLVNSEIAGAAESASRNANARELRREFMSQYKSALAMMCTFKKVSYLIENLRINVPGPKIHRSGSFIFKTEYSCCENDIKNEIWNSMADQIKKTGVPFRDNTDLVRQYMLGKAELKQRATSLAAGLEKDFWNDFIKIDKTLYRIQDDHVEEAFDCSMIEDALKQNKIEDISHSSLGNKSSAYLEFMLLQNASIVLFDQPEDNIDNDYISTKLVPLLKKTKRNKQFIFVTHNPSIAVYGDAFNYIHAVNDGKAISYSNYYLEDFTNTEDILTILDGGRLSFFNRNEKYQNVVGGYKWAK